MASYIRKYTATFASTRNQLAQWSAEHIYGDEPLILPFPTLAIFDSNKNSWFINIKAWLYLPFESKKIKSYVPVLPKRVHRRVNSAKSNLGTEGQSVDEKEQPSETPINDRSELCEVLQNEFGTPNENPDRLRLFFVGKSARICTKSIINDVEHLLKPSDENGFIEEQLELPDEEIQALANRISPESNDRKFEYKIQIDTSKRDVQQENYKIFACPIYVLSSQGISIVSDIDDTIKITNVHHKYLLLKHTFYKSFMPVEGINEIYQQWSKQQCQFHYVSASPWQLFPALCQFLEKHKFPMGTMHLRKFSWSVQFIRPSPTFKTEIIADIIAAYPFRKYICVGDSGERDPEIYAELYDMFPQQIAHIFIRDTCRVCCLPSCYERYSQAFKGVPKQKWTVFKYARNIETNIARLLSL